MSFLASLIQANDLMSQHRGIWDRGLASEKLSFCLSPSPRTEPMAGRKTPSLGGIPASTREQEVLWQW